MLTGLELEWYNDFCINYMGEHIHGPSMIDQERFNIEETKAEA